MKVTFKTDGAPGPFQKRIVVTTDAPDQEEIRISMKGSVKEGPGAKIQVTPRKADFGTVKAGGTAKLQFTLSNTGTMPLQLNKVYSQSDKHIYADWTGKDMAVDPGKSTALTVEITPQKPGPYSERFVIESNAKNAPKTGYIVLGTGKVE
jgi:hypothetical protein